MIQELKNSTMINSQAIQKVKNATMVNTQAIANMESYIGQIATHLGEREKGKFPSQPMPNPKAFAIGNSSNSMHRHEQVQSIVTLRSERQVEPSRAIPTIKDSPRAFIPKAPYPKRLKASKKNAQFVEILEVFK